MKRTVPVTLPTGSGLIDTVTVAGALATPTPSVTTSENVNVVSVLTAGAVKVGAEAVVLESVTAGEPAVCVQA